ncbi:MAG: amidophosphoribosyltransferase [Deltaproteobacteria bacterium]|jgi:amidophosphoribosyltransferase|nr:amidophosphoribosyltransferase [Deltaproteobacteria bacterium]
MAPSDLLPPASRPFDRLTPEELQALARAHRADRFHDECGVFGVHGDDEASHLTYLGLYAIQHRGQESCGIVASNGREHVAHRAMGLVADTFGAKILDRLKGRHAIGHVRYSTAGGSLLRNAQPICANTDGGPVSIAHNGNLVNAGVIRRELEGRGAIFGSTSDSEVILHLLARSREAHMEDRFIDAISRVKGAFSILLLTDDALIAARDPHGFRPLSIGRKDGAYVFASETCALDLIGATHERDVEPGEVVVVRRGRLRSMHPFGRDAKEHFCIFEHIYFARPDSHLVGHNVYAYRKELGRVLAREHAVPADMVSPVLDSGSAAALGYAEEAGIPYETALIRNHYVSRSFIEPTQTIRDFKVRVKHNAIRGFLEGKRIVLVDDSIVRGTTLVKIVGMLRAAGAREVHVRISSPPTIGPCHYGIDTPNREELIACRYSVEEIREQIGADSLGYLSIEGLRASAAGELKRGICDACFSDDYPIEIDPAQNAPQLSLFRPAKDDEPAL